MKASDECGFKLDLQKVLDRTGMDGLTFCRAAEIDYQLFSKIKNGHALPTEEMLRKIKKTANLPLEAFANGCAPVYGYRPDTEPTEGAKPDRRKKNRWARCRLLPKAKTDFQAALADLGTTEQAYLESVVNTTIDLHRQRQRNERFLAGDGLELMDREETDALCY